MTSTAPILYSRGELSVLRIAAAWRAVYVVHPATDTTFAQILYDDEPSFFSVKLAPSTLSEPARIVTTVVNWMLLGPRLRLAMNENSIVAA